MTNSLPPRAIVVGFEPSGRSDAAGCRAVELHQRYGATLEIVHALDRPLPESVSFRPDRAAAIRADIEAKAWEALVNRVGELAGDIGTPIEELLHLTFDHPGKALVERARAREADLIVMGYHAPRGWIDFGGATRTVIAKSKTNLWVERGTFEPLRKILLPTDLSDASLAAAREVCALAAAHGASVRVLHCHNPSRVAYAGGPGSEAILLSEEIVAEESRHAEERFHAAMDAFEWGGVEHELVFDEGEPISAALELQDEVDLIALGSHGRTGLAAAVFGNVAHGILRAAHKPVLVVRLEPAGWQLP